MSAPSRRPRIEIVALEGGVSRDEGRAAQEAITRLVESEREARSSSVWLRAARAQGRRLGMYDYRDRFSSEDAWRLSARFPPGGREYPGLLGRGDAR